MEAANDKGAVKFNVMILSFRTDRSGQKVQTKIRLGLLFELQSFPASENLGTLRYKQFCAFVVHVRYETHILMAWLRYF